MNGYAPRTPRVAFGAAAVVMAAVTLGASVVIPATIEAAGSESRVIDASRTLTPLLSRLPATNATPAGQGRGTDATVRDSCDADCSRESMTDASVRGRDGAPVPGHVPADPTT